MKTITLKDLQSPDNPGNGWYMIESSGEHHRWDENDKGKREERILVIDNEAVRKIVESFDEELLVDRDHLSHDLDKDTAAMAWVKELAGLDDGTGTLHLAGNLEFTNLGEPMVKGKAYKHWSSEYYKSEAEDLRNKRFRPTKLVGLALTNRPNNAIGQLPISSRVSTPEGNSALQEYLNDPDNPSPSQDPESPEDKNSEEETQNKPKQQERMDTIAELKTLLGLPEDAADQDILDAVTALADTANGAAVSEAETLVETEGLSDLPEEVKQELIDELVTNRKRGLIFLETLKSRSAAPPPANQPRYQSTGRKPALDPKAKGAAREKLILNRADEIIKSSAAKGKTVSFWKARDLAKSEFEKKQTL